MRKFRLIKWDNDYNPLKPNEVYDADLIPEGWGANILWNATNYPEEWQEVFEQETANLRINTSPLYEGYILPPVVNTKTLHKDTDLGYFSGLAMQALISTKQPLDINWCIRQAEELIKQLDAKS